jgi:hypothetical protein
MRLYAAPALHATDSFLGLVEESGKRILGKKLPNDPAAIREGDILYPFHPPSNPPLLFLGSGLSYSSYTQ